MDKLSVLFALCGLGLAYCGLAERSVTDPEVLHFALYFLGGSIIFAGLQVLRHRT